MTFLQLKMEMADDKGEDVWDSWEEMVDSGGLDKRLEKEEQTLQETRKKEDSSSQSSQPIVLEEDTHRTKYQPQLKLMRRQNEPGDAQQETDVTKNSKMTAKSLAEREAEYAQARLRILGPAKNEEDEETDRSVEPARTSKTSSSSSKSKKPKSATSSKKGSTAKR